MSNVEREYRFLKLALRGDTPESERSCFIIERLKELFKFTYPSNLPCDPSGTSSSLQDLHRYSEIVALSFQDGTYVDHLWHSVDTVILYDVWSTRGSADCGLR